MGDLLATIGLLAVRQEICKTIYESGGVELIFQVLVKKKEWKEERKEKI